MKIRIYALIDPRDKLVRYIGKSRNPYVRLGEHYRDWRINRHYNKPLGEWLEQLEQNDIFPIVEIIESIPVGEDWQEREKFHISAYRSSGHPLLNITAGGIGSFGTKRSAEVRAKMSASQKGKKHTEETKKKIRSIMLSNPPERIKKMRDGWYNFSKTPEGQKSMANRRGCTLPESRKLAIGLHAKRFWDSMDEIQRQEFLEKRKKGMLEHYRSHPRTPEHTAKIEASKKANRNGNS